MVGGQLLGQSEQSVNQEYKELEEGDLEDSKKEADCDSKDHCAQDANSLVVMGAVKTRVVSRGP